MSMSSAWSASAVEAVAKRKQDIEISCNRYFFSIACETFGLFNQVGIAYFISVLGHRFCSNIQETSFSTTHPFIQRFNVVCFANSVTLLMSCKGGIKGGNTPADADADADADAPTPITTDSSR